MSELVIVHETMTGNLDIEESTEVNSNKNYMCDYENLKSSTLNREETITKIVILRWDLFSLIYFIEIGGISDHDERYVSFLEAETL